MKLQTPFPTLNSALCKMRRQDAARRITAISLWQIDFSRPIVHADSLSLFSVYLSTPTSNGELVSLNLM